MTAALLLEQFDHLFAAPADVEQLNRAILTLAVQGRLVPQDPQGESSSRLVARIKVAKEKLVQNKTIAKTKPLPSISDKEIPFELPKGWTWVRLDELIRKVGAGSTPKGGKQVYEDTGIKFIRSQNVYNDGLRLEGVAHITEATNKKMAESIVQAKDILLNITGASIARSALVSDDFDIANVNQHVTIIRLVDPEIRHFIHLCITSPYGYNLIMSVQVGISREGLNMGRLREFVFPLPPLAEQKRIVARVEQLFAQTRALAEKLARAQSNLDALNQSALFHLRASDSPEEFQKHWAFIAAHFETLFNTPEHIAPLRQSILELAVRGKLTRREPGDESARMLLERIYQEKQESFPQIKESEKTFDLPKEWEFIRLGELARFVDYRGHTPTKTTNGMRLITARNVRMGRLNTEPKEYVDPAIYDKWMTRGIPRKGDLLFTTEAPMGNVCMLDTDEKALFAQRLITLKMYGNVETKFAMYALMSQPLQQQILEKSSGVTARGIKAKLLKTVLMPLPSLAEQARIVAKVEQLLGLCDALESSLQAGQVERRRLIDSILSKVMVGEG